MKYRHSTAQSADYLRLALKRMSQQDAGLHPASYALWYEYVAGTNPVLKAAVDAQIERDGQLNEATTHALYARHVADFDTQTASRIGDSVNPPPISSPPRASGSCGTSVSERPPKTLVPAAWFTMRERRGLPSTHQRPPS